MKKIGCLTFHASHNYGSVLQCFALKKAIEDINESFQYSVINLRSDYQDHSYFSPFRKKDLKSLYTRFFCINQKYELDIKGGKFESFMRNEFNLTERFEVDNFYDISDSFDTIICGSDQIWNVRAYDFSWFYFLESLSKSKKISYACSMGTANFSLTEEETNRIKKDLKSFSFISVRDSNTKETIESLTELPVNVCIDPTLLLSKEQWFSLIAKYKLDDKKNKYILFYDLSHKKENWLLAKKISHLLKTPLLITNVPCPRLIKYSLGVKKDYSCGPVDFINYIKNATLVLTSSFHGLIFSSLFNIPFFSINAEKDERIFDFLKKINMENRNVNNSDYLQKIAKYDLIDFSNCNHIIEEKRKQCLDLLKENL